MIGTLGGRKIWVSSPRDEASEAQLVDQLITENYRKAEDEAQLKILKSKLSNAASLSGRLRGQIRRKMRRVNERLSRFQGILKLTPAQVERAITPMKMTKQITLSKLSSDAAKNNISGSKQPSTRIQTPSRQAQLSAISRIKAEAGLFSSPLMRRNIAKAPRAPQTPRTITAFQARDAEIGALKKKGEEEESENQTLRELARVLFDQNQKMKSRIAVLEKRAKITRKLLKVKDKSQSEGSMLQLDEKQQALIEKLGFGKGAEGEEDMDLS